jgi:hypothetical protein
MDIYNEDVLDLWRALNRHGVKYILIGGFAVNLHKHYRTTGDINLYVDDTSQNREYLGEALEELKMSTKMLVARMQFVPGWSIIHLPNGFPLDIMTSVKGLEHLSFDECYSLASIAQIEDVSVRFLHINHLLQSKRAANRPKDQIDVLALEEIRRIEQAGQ